MAALAVELGSSWRDVPPPVVAGCARAGVPVVAFHRPVRFIEITEAVHGAVVNAQFALLARGEEIHRRFTELILQGRGVPEILAELCAAVGNPVVLEDAGGSLVYYVSGPPGDDLALSAWADVHRGTGEGGRFAVDVRLLDSSWGRLLALALDKPTRRLRPRRRRARGARGGDRPAGAAARRAAAGPLARRVPVRAGRRARGGGRRAPARRGARPVRVRPRRPAAGRGGSLARRAGRSRASASAPTGSRGRGCRATCAPRCPRPASPCCSGPRDVDLLILLALGSRGYDAALAEHVADLFHGALDRHGLGPADAALAIGAPAARGSPPGRRCGGCGARRARRRRLPVTRWHDARRPGVADLLHDLRDTPRARRVRRRAARPAAGRRVAAHPRAAGDAGGLPGGGRPEGRGGARAAPRAPVAVPAAAPDRGGCSASRWTTRTSCSDCTWPCALAGSAARRWMKPVGQPVARGDRPRAEIRCGCRSSSRRSRPSVGASPRARRRPRGRTRTTRSRPMLGVPVTGMSRLARHTAPMLGVAPMRAEVVVGRTRCRRVG